MKKIFKSLLILSIVSGWLFSGLPQMFNFPPIIQEALAAPPGFRVVGAQASSIGAITPAPGAGRATNDIDLLFVETANQAATLSTAAGFVELTNIGVGVAAGADGTRLTVFWRRWDGVAGSPTVADSGDHQIAVIASYSGVITTGNPWDVFGTNPQTPATTAGSVSAVITTVANTLVVIATAGSLPDANTANAEFSGWTNANLAGLLERFDVTRSVGNGGSIGIADGTKATAASTGATTFTSVASATKANVHIALKPPPPVLNNFLVEAAGGGSIGTQTAGTPFSIRITARDADNNTFTSFTGTVTITSTGTLSAGGGTTAAFTAGVLASHSVTISNAGTFTITATSGAVSGKSNAFTVNAGALNNFLVEAPVGGNWYNSAWNYRKKITIDPTKVGAGGVTNFPVLISRTDADLPSKAQASGNDILFTASDGTTKLSHEIENYVSATGELVAWVKVPSVSSAAATDIYLYYGNAAAANQQDPANVWDANFKGVWHLRETTGGAGAIRDSTSNANHGTDNLAPTLGAAGQIGNAVSFAGVGDYVDAGASTTLDFGTGAFTVSAWLNPTNGVLDYQAIIAKVGASPFPGWVLQIPPTDNNVNMWIDQTDNAASSAVTISAWSFIAFTRSAGVTRLFVNGAQTATGTSTLDVNVTLSLKMGWTGSWNGFSGRIDEARVSNADRSAAWILTEYNNQNSPSTFYSVGAETAGGGAIGTQTAGTPFSIRITARDASNNTVTGFTGTVTITSTGMLSAGGGTTAAFTTGVLASHSVTISNAGTFTITATSGAVSGTSNAFTVNPGALGGFNAYETSTVAGAIIGVIKTKVAGAAVSVDMIALNVAKTAIETTFTGTVRVEVLNASDNTGAPDANGCRPTWTVIQTLSPDPAFIAGDLGRKTITFTQPNSFRNARIRVSFPTVSPTVIGCSNDNFAIRPANFSVAVTDNTWDTAGTGRPLTNTGATGGNVHKAGQNFTITVTPSPGTATNYDGSPTVSTLTCTLPAACANGTLTVGAFSGAGTRVSNTATYSEAGAFNLTLVDQTYASVDAADTPADCSASGQYVCQSPAPVAVGRFVPDRFDFTGANTPQFLTFGTAACASRSFTYIGQRFWYTPLMPSATVRALNAAGAVTTNYKGALFKLTAAGITETYSNNAVGPALDTTLIGTPSVASGDGTGTYTASAAGTLAYQRSITAPVPAVNNPFTANLSLSVTATDSSESAVAGNGTISTPVSLMFNGGGGGIAFDAVAAFRYGRLRLGNANGSQLVPLPVRMETQYWGFTNPPTNTVLGFIVNTADNCTRLDGVNIEMSNYQGALAPAPNCKTRLPTTPVTFDAIAFAKGRAVATLTPPTGGATGSVNLTVRLEQFPAGSPQTCISTGAPSSVLGENATYLQGNWTGVNFDQNPTARASFGVYPGSEEVIFIRENF